VRIDFKNVSLKLWPIGLILLLNVIFFGRLFINREVFYTPGFGTSDLIDQNIPFRKILIDSLKQGKLPLWVSQMGQGFPLFAEGQVGALNLFNLIPSLIFPLDISLNVTYFLIFSLLAISTYLYIRRLGLSSGAGLLAALALTFSAKTVVSLHHLNLLLSFSFFVLCLFIVESFLQSQKKPWLLFLAFSFSQLIFAGHPQILFYSALFLGLYIGFRCLCCFETHRLETFEVSRPKPRRFTILMMLLAAFLLGLLASLPQLLPTLQLAKDSTRVSGSLSFEPYPLRLKDFLMFLRPDFFGNPRYGSYPINGAAEGFFWENELHIGLLPFVLSILGAISCLGRYLGQILKKVKINLQSDEPIHRTNAKRLVLFLLVAVAFSLILSLGKASPFAFVFSLPFFNLFRMPSRFILFADFWLVILAGLGFDYLLNFLGLIRSHLLRRAVEGCPFTPPLAGQVRPFQFFVWRILAPSSLLLLTLIDLWSFGFNYNPRMKISDLTTSPDTAKFLEQDKSQFRIVDFGSDMIWNSVFWKKGWEGQDEYYQKFLNSLTPNSNLLYGISSAGSYAGIVPQRANFIFDIINKDLSLAADSTVTVTDKMLKLFSLTNTKYFISGFNLKNPDLKYLGQTQFDQKFSNYGIWENTKVLPRAYLVSRVIKVKTMDQAKQALYQENFDPTQEAVVETVTDLSDLSNLIDLDSVNPADYQITQLEDRNETLTFKITTSKPGYLYPSDSYDLHWHAFVDGVETKIYPANVNGRLIKVEKGEHLIRFTYNLFELKVR